jgi:Tol biopolymer transport system component
VVFVSNRPSTGGNFSLQLVTRNIDGTGDQVLTLPMLYEGLWAPTYSPDGSKIAMEMWGVDTSNTWYDGIWVSNADGSNPQMLTNPATADCNCHDQTPAFSPDGSQITFSRQDWTSGQEDVYIMNADGSAATKLAATTGNSFEPMALNIAGVGDRILFSSNRDNVDATGGTGYELYSMTLDGNSLTRLTNNNLYDSFNFSFGGGTDCWGGDARVNSHRRFHE